MKVPRRLSNTQSLGDFAENFQLTEGGLAGMKETLFHRLLPMHLIDLIDYQQ
jgi:hypothetical protein